MSINKLKKRRKWYIVLSCRILGNAGTLFEKNKEDREFVVDSGASMHTLSKRVLSSDELQTLRKCRNTTTVVTANEEVQTNEEAQVYVYDLDLFVTVQLLEDTPAALSLGKLCEEHDYTNECASGQKPHLTKDGKKIHYKTQNYVPLVVPGVSSSSNTSSSSTLLPQDYSLHPANLRSNEEVARNCNEAAAGKSSEGLPEWLEDFTENLEIVEMPAAANISHYSDPERTVKVAPRKHSIIPISQKTIIAMSASEYFGQRKFGDLITADHNVFNEGCVSEQPWILSRGTGFSHSMDSLIPVQNKNFSADGKKFTNVSRAV